VLVFEPPVYCRRQSARQPLVKAPSEKTLDELAEDMRSRPEGLTHLMAKAEMESRLTSAQRRAKLTCSWLQSRRRCPQQRLRSPRASRPMSPSMADERRMTDPDVVKIGKLCREAKSASLDHWARIGAIMVVCFWHDALAADELPREIVGNWCVAIERMLPGKTYTYRRCKDGNWDIIVRWDGFDAQETSCELNTIKRQGAAWLASFGCSGAGLTWLEDDEIRVGKDGWTLEAKIKNVRRVGDPIRYCLGNKC
jgi:hypothetical protein